MKNFIGRQEINGPIDLNNYINAEDLGKILGVKPNRFRPWYNWYLSPEYKKPDNFPKLPPFIVIGRCRYWKKSDIPALEEFKNALGRGKGGVMGEYNARNWQQRGKSALVKKGRIDLVEKYFNK